MNDFLKKQLFIANIYKFYKFIIGGIIGYAINLLITLTLTELFSLYYLLSYAIGLICGIIFNFLFAVKIIFNIQSNHIRIFIFYIISVGIFFLLNLFTVKFLTELLNIDYKILIITVTGFYLAFKYFLYDNFIFKNKFK